MLKQVAVSLQSSIRKEDFVVRYGGDEFLIILKNCNKEQANNIIQRTKDKLNNLEKFNFPITFSFGIQEVKNKSDFFENIKKADEKMYNSKKEKKK